MKHNVGGIDRTARYILGGAAMAVAVLAPLALRWKMASGILGAIGLATAATQYCPANDLLKVDTGAPERLDEESEHLLTMNYR